MNDNNNQSIFLYPIITLTGVIGAILTFVGSLEAIVATLGLALSLILIGIGVMGWFVSQKKMSLSNGIQYSIIWTLIILLAGVGYYLIVSGPVAITGTLMDNSLSRNPKPGYEVQLYNHQTGITSTVRTDAQGNFRFEGVREGEYDLIINDIIIRSEEAASGVQKLMQSDIRAGRFYLDSLGIDLPVTQAPTATPTAPVNKPTSTAIPVATDTNTPTPSPTNTPDPLQIARTPVARNADWTPIERDFGIFPMVLVPSGCFDMGENGEGGRQCFDEPFWIDKYEVAQTDFARLGGTQATEPGFSGDNRPVERVTWYEAQDFCESRGGQLPGEAQWEYAARGPDGLAYPWGHEFVGGNVVHSGNSNNQTADVGSRPAGRSWVGAMDMSGNVWEWTRSEYRDYPYNPEDGREDNSRSNVERVVRGGSWYGVSNFMRADDRGHFVSSVSIYNLGFRCVRPSS